MHVVYDIDTVYESRKWAGGTLTCIEDCVDSTILKLEEYIKIAKKN